MLLICLSFYRDTCLSCEDGGVNICGLGDHLSGLGVRPQCSLHICSVSLPCFLKQMVLICEILINFKNMLVRNENKNIKWQGRSCHVHRDCHRYHTSSWTNHHSCEGGTYKHSKAWNDFWNNLFSQLMSQRGNDNDWKQRFGHNLVMVFAYPIALLYM